MLVFAVCKHLVFIKEMFIRKKRLGFVSKCGILEHLAEWKKTMKYNDKMIILLYLFSLYLFILYLFILYLFLLYFF